jgi:hypothetical protein
MTNEPVKTTVIGIVAALAFAIAAALRFALIEPEALAHVCESHSAPGWCAIRGAVVFFARSSWLGGAALLTGVIATVSRSSRWALAALGLGLAALLLYSAAAGAVTFLLGGLVLARCVATGRQQDARSEDK